MSQHYNTNHNTNNPANAAADLLAHCRGRKYTTVLADPPWQFQNRTGKVAPEHRRLHRYSTMGLSEIMALPVGEITTDSAHLYLWVPNALLPEGLQVMAAWGFRYVTNLIWHKVRRDGGSDGRGMGFYFRNVTEVVLFGVKGTMRTLDPGRRQVNLFAAQKLEHSRKPTQLYDIIESCSPAPYIELFARGQRSGWTAWGDQAGAYQPTRSSTRSHRTALETFAGAGGGRGARMSGYEL